MQLVCKELSYVYSSYNDVYAQHRCNERDKLGCGLVCDAKEWTFGTWPAQIQSMDSDMYVYVMVSECGGKNGRQVNWQCGNDLGTISTPIAWSRLNPQVED